MPKSSPILGVVFVEANVSNICLIISFTFLAALFFADFFLWFTLHIFKCNFHLVRLGQNSRRNFFLLITQVWVWSTQQKRISNFSIIFYWQIALLLFMDDDFVDPMDTNTNARINKRRQSQPNDKNIEHSEHSETDSPDSKRTGNPTTDLIKSMVTTNAEVKKYRDKKSSSLEPVLFLLLKLMQHQSPLVLSCLIRLLLKLLGVNMGNPQLFLIQKKLSANGR